MKESSLQKSEALDLKTFDLQPGTTLIEASAGTGKTYTIQYIVLDLLLKGLDLKEILVVTFTEAATKELCERLQGFLAEVHSVLEGESEGSDALAAILDRARERIGEEALQRIVRRALLHVDEAPIHTIHGFCQRALQENPIAADTAFASEICADPARLIEDLVRDFLCEANLRAPSPLPDSAGLENLCRRGGMLTGLLSVQNPFEGDIEEVFRKLENSAMHLQAFGPQIDTIDKELCSFEGKLNARRYSNDFFAGCRELLRRLFADPIGFARSASEEKNLEKLCACTIEKAFLKAHKGTAINSGFFIACEVFRDANASLDTEFLRYFDTWFIREFNRLKSDRGQITYDDMILHLDRALQRHEHLKEQLQKRYRAALVDEFQDTDARQYSIFRTLFAEDSPAGTRPWFAMIGDPKQSIYSFRGADINAYLEARADAHHRYTLPVNYRSEPGMVEGVNTFFERTNLGEANDGSGENAILFEPVKAADGGGKPRLVFAGEAQPPRLYERIIRTEENKHSDALEACMRQLPNDISELLKLSKEGRILIRENGEGEAPRRTVELGDIAVLVDTHREAACLQRLFQEHNLLAVRGKSGDIFGTEEASHFLQFLRACLDPGERRLNVLLVSPLFGKTDAAMKHFAESERQNIHELFSLLGRTWKDGASISSIWLRFLNDIGARARLLRRTDGERLLTNYLHICELAQELERSSSLSPERLTDRILEMVKEGKSSLESQTEANLIRLESDEEAIRILTMHASKGLEFPVVFLPSLWQKCVRGKNSEVMTVCPSDPDCLESIAKDPELTVSRQKSEALRIGYVAMTRAVHFCVYYNALNVSDPHPQSNHAAGWFDNWLCEQRAEHSREGVTDDVFLAGLAETTPMELPPPAVPEAMQARQLDRAIPDSYQITSFSALSRGLTANAAPTADPSIRGGAEEVHAAHGEDPTEAAETESDGTLLLDCFPLGVRTGTCVHEIIERCDFTDKSDWDRHIHSGVACHFPDGGSGLLEERVSAIQGLLNHLVASPWPVGPDGSARVDLSAVGKGECLHEMEFYFPVRQVDVSALEKVIEGWANRNALEYTPGTFGGRDIDGYLTGSIDLLLAQGGRYYVLDWKTNSPLPGYPRSLSAYDREGMHAQMCHGGYYLQALIYSVATAAFLRDRMGSEFTWDTRMGGFIYCFVRGLGPNTGWMHGSFLESEIDASADALGQREPQWERALHE